MTHLPRLDRKAFDTAMDMASSYGVWVQVNEAYQTLLPCTRQQALRFAERGLDIMPVWGQLCDGCLELSLTSQWIDSLVPGFNGCGHYKKKMRNQVVASMREYMTENSAPLAAKQGMISGMLIFAARAKLITPPQYKRLQKVKARWARKARQAEEDRISDILEQVPGI